MTDDTIDDLTTEASEEVGHRHRKLQELRAHGPVYVNDFRRDALAEALHQQYDNHSHQDLEQAAVKVAVAGRMMTRRLMGKASFFHVQDMTGQIQIYARRDDIPEGVFEQFKQFWDLGDIVGVEGELFKTKTGELSVKAKTMRLLSKGLRPLPDKFHGLVDQEQRYRQRYLDLTMNQKTRQIFRVRSQTMAFLRRFFEDQGFIEVETPMMHPIPGGAAARPFITHHNALDMDLYLRIAPELYLKRLVVGGMERVFEINRNFRNEGLSTRHNPEFTMLEFYQAYANYHDLMELTEVLMQALLQTVLGSQQFTYQGHSCDFTKPIERITYKEAILRYNSELSEAMLNDEQALARYARSLELPIESHYRLGHIWQEIFESTVEDRLVGPVFVTEFPADISPLARENDDNPFVTDRFELFVAGQEIANGFSELNDPEEQARRFRQQVAEQKAGHDEAMAYDDDFIRALEHGMPPTAGEGIGIDRLVMLLTDSASIREVILFPQLRPRQ